MTKGSPELNARLNLLANETPMFDGDQRLLESGDPFDAIMNLIDQTVIPAVLEITDGNRVFVIEVFGRRLSRLPGIIEVLTASDTDTVSDAARRIAEFADTVDGPLRVRDLASTASEIDPAQSISISAIAAAAGRAHIDANAPPISQFSARLGDAITVAIAFEGDTAVQRWGDVDLCAELEQDLAELRSQTRQGDGPDLLLYQAGADDQSVRGVAFVQNAALVFAIKDIGFTKTAALFYQSTDE